MFLASLSRTICLGAILCALLLVTGCESNPHKLDLPPLHPVSGTVTYQGRPAAGFRVLFNPLTSTGKLKFSPQAVTDDTGAYKLTTTKPGDGAPEGEFAVTFLWPDHLIKPDDPDPVPEVDRFRGAYARPESSAYKATVKAGENVIPPFDLR